MVNQALIHPRSILVAGGSNNLAKPGGKILKNIIEGGFNGALAVLNPHHTSVQGIKSYQLANDLPEEIDLAIIAIAAAACPALIETLAYHHQTKAFIVISAGFSELNTHGAELEKQIKAIIDSVNGCLIGPNCIGIITPWHSSIFTTPVPKPHPQGIDFITASGATAVFTIEAGLQRGVKFNHIFSVGNSAQTSVEDVLVWMDHNFTETSSRTLLLYLESIKHPQLLLEHALSLHHKGCTIAAIKAGTSEAGSRAATSHTGALAGNDLFIDALFRKAGIIRCYSREQLINTAAILLHKPIIGNKMAIITHAGGPAVMLTDTLANAGIEVPKIPAEIAQKLLQSLYSGSSASDPIDILATGTAAQLATVINVFENELPEVNAIAIIFGSAGLFDVDEVYTVIAQKQEECRKPIFAILPSVINASEAINHFIAKGHTCFTDEVLFGDALSAITNKPVVYNIEYAQTTLSQNTVLQSLTVNHPSPIQIAELLDWAHIPRVAEHYASSANQLEVILPQLTFPVVAKAGGINHKSDVGGVVTDIKTENDLRHAFNQLMQISGCNSIVIQPFIKGFELFIGALREPGYSPLIMCGAGGILVEIMNDTSCALAPIGIQEARAMIRQLKIYKVFKGVRGKPPINETLFATLIVKVSEMMMQKDEIAEMDLNPLIATDNDIYAVDTRIRMR